MKKKSVILLVVALALAIMCISLTGCKPSEKKTFTVKFDLNYLNATNTIADQTVVSGKTAVKPTDPTRENFTFKGWYKDKELSNPYNFETDKITADTTLYAKWSQSLYYIAGSFTGYESKMEGFNLEEVKGKEGWYGITVNLTEDVRDTAYDGHYYKITNGTWDANGCWGVDNYVLQPAPKSPTGGGLGSIWIYENGTLTVYFDSVNKVIYDTSMVREFSTPRIYGDFNTAMERGSDWSTANGEALELTDADGDGLYKGLYKIPAYTGANEKGYSMAVAINEKYYINEWGNGWGTNEQYKFDGEAAGMGGVSYLKPEKETIYEFIYDSVTHITSVTAVEKDQIVAFANPVIYGDFSDWQFEGPKTVTLTDTDQNGKYTGFVKLQAYAGEGDGYMLAVALSKKLYDDEWGIRWGAEEQYKFDSTAAGMGGVSYLKPEKETIYEFIYDSATHITTVNEVEKDQIVVLDNPVIYGDFSGWQYEGDKAIILTDDDHNGTYEGTITLPAYTGEGDGYMLVVMVSKKLYDDEWGIRWGAQEQYKFDGTTAGMGEFSYLKPAVETTYSFVYDSATHVTTVTEA